MNEKEILTILEPILLRLSRVEEDVARISLVKSIKRRPKCCLSQRLRGGLTDPDIRDAIMRLKAEGKRYKDIDAYIRDNWPGQPEKHVSKSAIHRFFQSAIAGRLREYGIDPPII
ncbi:MAG: hypothetical protein CSYNP_03743 [Syntrophus sp. SKADARSKE-3]|nr:hypothetical protein [Syntrophus sp. SKADARSKE-3]